MSPCADSTAPTPRSDPPRGPAASPDRPPPPASRRGEGLRSLATTFLIPVYNEDATLEELVRRIKEVMRRLPGAYEILFVDDGSTDGSPARMDKLFEEHAEIKILRFRRNFGKAAALNAGFAAARGELVFTMDADLQDDPAEIPRFVRRMGEGYDLLSGWKVNRRDPLSKTLPSKLFNLVLSTFSGVRLHDFNCGFKCYRKEVLRHLRLYGELHRFVPILAHAKGFKVGEMEVVHHPRRHGRSKYGFERLPRGLLDFLTVMLITRGSRTPLHLFAAAGTFSLLLASAVGASLIAAFATGGLDDCRHLVWLGIVLLFTGVQMFGFGLLSDVLSRRLFGRSMRALRKPPSREQAARA